MLRIILSLLLIFISMPAAARWAKFEEAHLEVIYENLNCNISSDGCLHCTTETRMKVLNREGRAIASNLTLFYTEGFEKIELLKAMTINGSQEHILSKKQIEDKPLASQERGFDQKRQVLLSFPHVRIGSEIYLKHTLKSNDRILNNFQLVNIGYGGTKLFRQKTVKVTSSLPLYIAFNDPHHSLEILKKGDSGKIHEVIVTLKKPLLETAVFEPAASTFSSKHYTWVTLSTMKNFNQFAKKLALDYEAVLNQPIPQGFTDIYERIKLIKDEIKQINTALAMVQQRVHYMGDWRSTKGRFIPRNLDTIQSTGSGDCKDFSALVGAILQKAQFKAQIALVNRGEGVIHELEFDALDLPPGDFNHAILKVIGKSGKVYWIDATNVLAMAQDLFPDIENRKVLVLDSKNPSYERIPAIDPHNSKTIVVQSLEINNDVLTSTGSIEYTGINALGIQEQLLLSSKKMVEDVIFIILSAEDLAQKNRLLFSSPDIDYFLEPENLKIAQNIKIQFKYRQQNSMIKTNTSPAFSIPARWVNELINISPEGVGDFFIGHPHTLERYITIKKLKVKNIERLNYYKTTPWVDIKKSCMHSGSDTVIAEKIVFKKSFILQKEIQSKEYQLFREELINNFSKSMIVLEE